MNTDFFSTTTTSITITMGLASTAFTVSPASTIIQASVAQQTYKDALEKLKQHMDGLANPFLVEDIREKLSQLCKEPLSLEDGILDSFSGLILPQETKDLLQVLNNAILFLGQEDVSHVREVASKIREDLDLLANHQMAQDFPSFEEFRILFNLPLIKKLPNEEIKEIRRLIDKKKTVELRKYLQGYQIPVVEADEQVKRNGYEHNFTTLISEIIEKKIESEKSHGIINNWGRKETFFEDKTLYIHDPDANKSLKGVIIKCKRISLKDGMENLCFTLHDKSEVYIPKTSFTPTLIKKIQYRFWSAISDFHLYSWLIKEYAPSMNYASAVKTYSSQDFNRLCYVTKIVENTLLKGINQQNANQYIQIKNEPDENELRLITLKEVENKINSLEMELLKEENQEFLNTLIDNLVHNKLRSIDMDSLPQNHDFKVHIEEISDKCGKDSSSILKNIVLNSIYGAVLENKGQHVSVLRTMKLLKEAHQHINKMAGKDAILFLGHSNSGKSTAVSYFLGLEMEEFVNRVDETVIRIKASETSNSNNAQPKIGQSLEQRPETLYIQGFSLLDYPNVCLLDCPGFHNTWSQDDEMCANYSIDVAVAKARTIRSLVLTIPIQTFVIDGANPVIDLIEGVRDRFPNLFELVDKNVFILITKTEQAPDVVEKLRNGSRIEELLSESEQQSGVMVHGAQQRYLIWKFLKALYDEKKIHFIDVHNNQKKHGILKHYTQLGGRIDKSQYVGAMQGKDMHMQFAKFILELTNTWTDSIMNRYLAIPQQIIKLQCKIEKIESEIIAKHIEDKDLVDEVYKEQRPKTLQDEVEILETSLERLRKAKNKEQASFGQLLISLGHYKQFHKLLKLNEELSAELENYKQQELSKLEIEIKNLEAKTLELQRELDNLNEKYEKQSELKSSITQLKAKIDQKKQLSINWGDEFITPCLVAMIDYHQDIEYKLGIKIDKLILWENLTKALIKRDAIQAKLNSLEKSKRNLAIIVHEQHETAQLLRDFVVFVLLVLGHNKGATIMESESSASIVATCENYIKTYDENIDKLKQEAKIELGFS